jgi:hypothetical protein
VLRAHEPWLGEIDESLAALLPRDTIEAVVSAVPAEFLPAEAGSDARARRRAQYAAFLWKRLKAPRPFLVSVITAKKG